MSNANTAFTFLRALATEINHDSLTCGDANRAGIVGKFATWNGPVRGEEGVAVRRGKGDRVPATAPC
ncbi:hypothetical protein GCM10009634_32980 [Saccharothrix xinjiangensis]